MIIILLGTPASGKGTQAELLEKKFGLYHFSTGQLFRKMKDKDPEIKELMEKGDLIPDSKVTSVIENFLTENDIFDNLIIDGSPRSLYQYQKIKEFLKSYGKNIDIVIELKISDEEAIRRLTARREDPKTGEVYNLVTNPPGPEVDLKSLIHREDDKEEAVRERLKVQKIPDDLYSAIKADGNLTEINGEQPIKDIFEQIVEIIEDVKQRKYQNQNA